MAPQRGVDTSAWWTAEALAGIAGTSVNVTGAVLVTALIGAALAVLTRSAAIAISVGAAYFILGEALLGEFWEALGRWGPAAANALATGGAAGMTMGAERAAIGYATAALLALGYVVVSVAISSTVLVRRDVTS